MANCALHHEWAVCTALEEPHHVRHVSKRAMRVRAGGRAVAEAEAEVKELS